MKRLIAITLILAAITAGYWWFNQPAITALEPASGAAALVGSGTIEAEIVGITAELGGRVIELNVAEGDKVTAGQILIELDKADLLAQKIQVEAGLTKARTNLDLIRAPARSEEITVAQAQLTQAKVAAEGAKQIWDTARKLINNPHELEARVNQAKAQLTEAKRNLEMAQVNRKRMGIQAEAASRNQSNHAALVQYEAAQSQLQAAQAAVKMAEVALEGAERQVEHLTGIHQFPLRLIVRANAAEAAYRQAEAATLIAEANLGEVSADPTPEDIAVAQAQAREAEAALAAVGVQLAKQTLTAPRNGLISQKLINPGELAAGTVLLELSDIDTVDLTVYIPETRIGQVKIGQQALIYVDAYDDEQFKGAVSFIAHEAEFTPRNVQTQEERVNLVFAVKISLDNADQRLKPGMPADAVILTTSQPSPTAEPSPTVSSQNIPQTSNTPMPTIKPIPTSTAAWATVSVTSTLTEITPTLEAEVITWRLNVRSGPGVNYPVISVLAQGQVVSVVSVDSGGGWLQIGPPSSENPGWISGNSTYVAIR